MPSEEQVIETIIKLNVNDIQSGLTKLEKNITSLTTETEKTLASLSKESGVYEDLIRKSNILKQISSDISKYKSGDITGTIKNNEQLANSVKQYTQIKQYVKDVNSLNLKTTTGLQSQSTELSKIQDKFNALNREAQTLQGHYKTIGSSSGLSKLSSQMSEIRKQQEIIGTLSSKGIVNLTSSDLKTIDSAKAKYQQLKNQVADTKAELSDIPLSGLAKGIVGRSLGYTALFATIAGVTQSMRAGIEYTLEYESGIKRLETILDISSASAERLEGNLAELGKTYGEQLGDINKVALELSRAGLALEQVAEASEVVIKLALLTGDSIEQSASSIISFVQVFGKDQFGQVISSVDELGAKLAYLANKSRLGTQDINTFANFALASAKATGLTIDAVNGLASALSNASFNASTIGTQIRKLTIALSSNSGAVQKYFETIGVNQANLAKRISQGGEESNKALLEFLEKIKSFNRESYNEALSGVEVLTKNVLQAIQNNAGEIQVNLRESLNVTSEELDKAKNITEDYRKTWAKFGENAKGIAQSVFDPFIDKATELARAMNNTVDEFKFFGVAVSKDVQLSTLTNAIDTTSTSFNKFKKGLGDTKEFEEVTNRLDLIRTTLYTLKTQAKDDNDYASISKINELLKKTNTLNQDITKNKSNILSSLNKNQVDSQIKSYTALIEKNKELLNSDSIKEGSKQWESINNLIITYENNIKSLKGSLGDLETIPFKNTLKFFSSADLDNVNASITKINKSVDIAKGKDLDILKGLNLDRLNRIQKEIPTFVTKIQSDLEASGIKLDLSGVTTFGDVSSEAIRIQEEIYKLQQSKEGKSKQEVLNIDLQVNAYTKAFEQLTRINEAQNSILKSQEKIETKQKAQTSETEKQLKQQDSKTNKMITQLVEQAKINSLNRETSDLLLLELNVRGENYAKLVSEEAKQLAITKLLKLGNEYQKAQTKEANAIDLAYGRVENKIKTQQIRVDELIGKKKEELASEKALRDLRASKDFQKLSEEEQQNQTKALENIIAQEKAYQGLNKAFTDYAKEVPTLNEALEQVGNVGLQSLENGMMDFFDVTSEGFGDLETLAKGVIKSIYQELIRTLIVKQAVSGIGSLFGFSEGGELPITAKANGGFLSTKKFANGGILSGGSGVRDDLYLGSASGSHVFAMGGEYFTKKDSVNSDTRPMLDYINKNGTVPQMGVTGATIVNTPTTINIENSTGTPIEADMIEELTKNNENDEYEKVINIMLRAKNEDSRIRSLY